MPSFKKWPIVFSLIALLFFASCTWIRNSRSSNLEQNLKIIWSKEKNLLKQIGAAQSKRSISLLQKEAKKIEEDLSKTKNTLKELEEVKELPKSKIEKYQESFFILSEVIEEVDSFLNFQLNSEEESKILAELSWHLTILSGKLAGSYNLISLKKFDEAKEELKRAENELNTCRTIVGQVSQRVSIGLEEVNNHLNKMEFLISMAENLANKKKITEEEREVFAKAVEEPFSSSLDVLSLSELNRDELIKQANLKLEEVARKLDIR